MKAHIVAIAKNEELYIENWLLHYFQLGFDKICIYDNNDDSNTLSQLINESNKLNDFRENILINTWHGSQNEAYKDYWNNHKNEFDWLFICDIDEFIDIDSLRHFCDKFKNSNKEKYENNLIKTALERYNSYKVITLRCVEYGDNDLIERDMSKSVYEVFNRRAYRSYEYIYKSFFNSNLIDKFETQCGHYLRYNNEKIQNRIYNFFIRHIRTYSLKEYLDQKYRVKHQKICNMNDIRRYLLSLYYFKINRWTAEKQKYIEEYRLKNNIIKTLYICSETFYNEHSKELKEKCCYVYGLENKAIEKIKGDFKFQGFQALKDIINDFDYVVFF